MAADEVGRRLELRLLRLAGDLGEHRAARAGRLKRGDQPAGDAELDQRRIAHQHHRLARIAERRRVLGDPPARPAPKCTSGTHRAAKPAVMHCSSICPERPRATPDRGKAR